MFSSTRTNIIRGFSEFKSCLVLVNTVLFNASTAHQLFLVWVIFYLLGNKKPDIGFGKLAVLCVSAVYKETLITN